VWLKNFVSPRTRQTYLDAVPDFIGFHGITDPEELRTIEQAHVIAWRDFLIDSGATPKPFAIYKRYASIAQNPTLFLPRNPSFLPVINVRLMVTGRPQSRFGIHASQHTMAFTPVCMAQRARHLLFPPPARGAVRKAHLVITPQLSPFFVTSIGSRHGCPPRFKP
jgi:hypothetical protein